MTGEVIRPLNVHIDRTIERLKFARELWLAEASARTVAVEIEAATDEINRIAERLRVHTGD